jgi:uncharacterized membrane protein
MAHAHRGGPSGWRSIPTVVAWPIVAVAVAVVVGLVVLWPSSDRPPVNPALGLGDDRLDATVTGVDVGPCANTDPEAGILCEQIGVEIDEGRDKGTASHFEIPVTDTNAVSLDAGDEIVVNYDPSLPEGIRVAFVDFQRQRSLLALAALFVAAVVLLGRFQGLRALLALGLTLAVVVGFLLPALLEGSSPLAVALVAAGVIAVAALYLTHGVNERTTIALLGTFASLALTGVLGAIFVGITDLTGFASEEALTLSALGGEVDIRGLLLAGLVIGSLGVLDDVTVTQVSAVWELRLANRQMSFTELYGAALRIGRDHIASTVNTLVLAYAGAALPVILLYTQAELPLGDVVTSEVIAVEVVRTLVGSIGLVASVPLTTALAAYHVGRGDPRGTWRGHAPAEHDEGRREIGWDDFAPRA